MYVDISKSQIPLMEATVWAVQQGYSPTIDKNVIEAFIAGFCGGYAEFARSNPVLKHSYSSASFEEVERIRIDYKLNKLSLRDLCVKYNRTPASIKGIFRKHGIRKNKRRNNE